MNYDFFADRQDKLMLLEFIFAHTNLQVFDHSSLPGEEIKQYKNTAAIADHFDLENGGQHAVTLQLWSPDFGGAVTFRKINLNPKYCKGYTYRYTTESWGLIQLYFGGMTNNRLYYSHIGHFNAKGAAKWEGIQQEKGNVGAWNWKVIEQTSRKLKYQLHNKTAVRKIGSVGVLPGADKLSSAGVAVQLFG